ncbi:Predicted dithiol-disulfide isomerase, DsbA family [Desulfotomaculum arcticum]|uniref:Predicted dithiol-disulfide isomerase, DsbA family n=1 Tax=Desulfotruncus arcticus DSM 17038 TaxID=1121424 RepID=A0A1I2S0U3_9FIRM|nr:Predicted dithiol-disulfide isomerase, DsbA family [Desulfotomaculum arcticum] [Desulfotruncus arcticus DSM 17038]
MEKWIGFELHPETPASGVKIAELLPEIDLDLMNRNLNANGNSYGVSFKRNDFLPNTRLALEASEFARAYNKFTEFHDRTFKAYFTEGQDIGNIMVLLNLAQEIGLDKAKLEEDLNNHTYAEVVEQNRTAAVKNNVTAIPTFIIADKIRITGANPYSRFQKALEEIIKP